MRWFALVLFLLVPLEALADSRFYRDRLCQAVMPGTKLRSSETAFYCFTDATDSNLLELTSVKTTICFDPDTESSTLGPATVFIRNCITIPEGSDVRTDRCVKILADLDGGGITPADDLPLTGDDGSGTRQRACIYGIPPGTVYVDVQVSAGGKKAVVVLKSD